LYQEVFTDRTMGSTLMSLFADSNQLMQDCLTLSK